MVGHTLAADRLYVADLAGLAIYDLSDLANPVLLARQPLFGGRPDRGRIITA